jgi:hypothetical protein
MTEDEKAIIAVLDADARAFWSKDFAAMATLHVQAPYTRRMGWTEAYGIANNQGWDAISSRMKDNIAHSPKPTAAATSFRRDNLNIHVSGDLAWLTFDQTNVDTGDERMDMAGVSHEMRVMEKVGGQWKIAYLSFLLEPAGSGPRA